MVVGCLVVFAFGPVELIWLIPHPHHLWYLVLHLRDFVTDVFTAAMCVWLSSMYSSRPVESVDILAPADG